MTEVFKTNIAEPAQAIIIKSILVQHFPGCRIVFDLEDCDRILKIVGGIFDPYEIQILVEENGFYCQILE